MDNSPTINTSVDNTNIYIRLYQLVIDTSVESWPKSFSINLYRDKINSTTMIRRKIDDFYVDSYGHANYGYFLGLEESNISSGLEKLKFKQDWNYFVDKQLKANENSYFMKFDLNDIT